MEAIHTPLPHEALTDSMETLFNLIEQEPEPAVRAVLGHQLFVFIHPYFDGDGRIGRFLMNTMLPQVAIRGQLFGFSGAVTTWTHSKKQAVMATSSH